MAFDLRFGLWRQLLAREVVRITLTLTYGTTIRLTRENDIIQADCLAGKSLARAVLYYRRYKRFYSGH